MRFWDKLGWGELYAMDQIQVNIPLLLLLVAVKSKPCLWREEYACGCEACSQPCAVTTVQSARPLDSRPWGYRLHKWSSVPSITSLYYLHIQEKGNKLFIEPLRASCRALGKGIYCDKSQSIQWSAYISYCSCVPDSNVWIKLSATKFCFHPCKTEVTCIRL